MRHIIRIFMGLLLAGAAAAAYGAAAPLTGNWVLNHELSREIQPDGPQQSSLLNRLPNASVSVGGMPLPGVGSGRLPPVAGNARDPKVLRCTELRIEPAGDALHLNYGTAGSDTLQRGNDQGLVSRWNKRKLTSRYETTSRKVSQTYEVRRDGRLLVTVRLNPNQGPAVVHKRVFDPVESS
jgi:hypothetical protein